MRKLSRPSAQPGRHFEKPGFAMSPVSRPGHLTRSENLVESATHLRIGSLLRVFSPNDSAQPRIDSEYWDRLAASLRFSPANPPLRSTAVPGSAPPPDCIPFRRRLDSTAPPREARSPPQRSCRGPASTLRDYYVPALGWDPASAALNNAPSPHQAGLQFAKPARDCCVRPEIPDSALVPRHTGQPLLCIVVFWPGLRREGCASLLRLSFST